MKKILYLLLLSPIVLKSQQLVPRFENDTLYTTSGYKIYKGQTLNLAEGSGKDGKFRFIKIRGRDNDSKLTKKSFVVRKLSDFKISGIGNAFIRIQATDKDSEREIIFMLAFDRAIESYPGLSSELIVPDEFKKKKDSVADQISELYKLYQDSILTKEEFETQKKKLLNQ